MNCTGDDLAGVVDLFGGLSREDLAAALVELAFKQGEDTEPSAFESDIDSALRAYELVELEPDAETSLLVAGPAAFPRIPEAAADLHHILDAQQRAIDRAEAGDAAAEKLHLAMQRPRNSTEMPSVRSTPATVPRCSDSSI